MQLLWRLRVLIGMEASCPIELRLIPIYVIVKCKRTNKRMNEPTNERES